MTLLSGIVAVLNRLSGRRDRDGRVGDRPLYGRVPQGRSSDLSLVALGSLVWAIAMLAVILPALGGMLIAAVPRPGFVRCRLAAPCARHRARSGCRPIIGPSMGSPSVAATGDPAVGLASLGR